MKDPKVEALMRFLEAIAETVREAEPEGVPAGVLYAVLMDKLSLDGFERVMAFLVKAGRVRKEGHLYYAGRQV